ncbi:MAG: sialate O-acetylesterase [Ruminococcaceae bacterium]|nr:sialate O-acetylesterase [Oscillospiraceae bacterium]
MNKFIRTLCLLLVMCFCTASCGNEITDPAATDETVVMEMNTDFRLSETLPRGDGQQVKVILLLGQSNASGSSIVSYLEKNSTPEDFSKYSAGYPSVLMNYCIDDHNVCSEGEYVKVDLTCGAAEGFFGPEVGMADVLSEAYPDERILILKYTMSGYSLHHHWLCAGERGSIYNAFRIFIEENMEHLGNLGYDARIGAICWMQGESDTSEFKAERYYDNQCAFVSYLRHDLAPYAEEGGIYFIDAGISNGPYCEPGYPAVNEAKRRFSELSSLNLYFSTIDAGLVTVNEPEGDPDWGHYDALCELELGRLFARYVIESYQGRE